MKKLFVLLCVVCAVLSASANEVEYDFSTAIPSVWTASPAPLMFETSGSARGAQWNTSATITLKGATDVTSVVITTSCNNDSGNSLAVSVCGKSWGSTDLVKETNVEKTFSGSAASGDIVIKITRSNKSVYIKKVVVVGNAEGGNTGGGNGDNDELDPNYDYAEPTIVTPTGTEAYGATYSFVQNNIKVECSTGAQTAEYFGCNAGQRITFTASKAIKAIVIDGYVKQNFSATVDHGTIQYVDASDDAVETDPVIVVTDIKSKTITISSDKQMRCYNVEFYFVENPDVKIDNTGSGGTSGGSGETYSYEWEPTTKSNIDITFNEVEAFDYSADLGYDCVEMYFMSDDYEIDLVVFTPYVESIIIAPGTYTISNTYDAGTVQASPGGDDYYDYPTFVATGFETDADTGETYYSVSYYIISGTLTVSSEADGGFKMVVSGTTYNGSTVNATFVAEGDATGITEMGNSRVPHNGKYLENGLVRILRNGRRYNMMGI